VWNMTRYNAGREAAEEILVANDRVADRIAAAERFHANLDGTRAVDEYEVGVRDAIAEFKVDPELIARLVREEVAR
jgi:hypothetical protein